MDARDKSIVIATRGSALALAQANMVLAQCREAFPDREFKLKVVTTTGDKLQAESSAEVDLPKGLFTKELEVALLNGDADLAVHSLKDLPTELPDGLALAAVTRRADVRDVLIYRADVRVTRLSELPPGFTIATSSPRRASQLLSRNRHLNVVPIRGNVPTRLRKLAEQPELGALVLAMAGLVRLNYVVAEGGVLTGRDIPQGLRTVPLSLEDMLPCVGQGALGIEIRQKDDTTRALVASLNDSDTECCALAERAFLRAMGGGCQTPVAAYAEMRDADIRLRAVSFETGAARYAERAGAKGDAEQIGQAVGRQLRG